MFIKAPSRSAATKNPTSGHIFFGEPPRGTAPKAVRGDLSVMGPMARSGADLARELAVIAGPDEWSEGIGGETF